MSLDEPAQLSDRSGQRARRRARQRFTQDRGPWSPTRDPRTRHASWYRICSTSSAPHSPDFGPLEHMVRRQPTLRVKRMLPLPGRAKEPHLSYSSTGSARVRTDRLPGLCSAGIRGTRGGLGLAAGSGCRHVALAVTEVVAVPRAVPGIHVGELHPADTIDDHLFGSWAAALPVRPCLLWTRLERRSLGDGLLLGRSLNGSRSRGGRGVPRGGGARIGCSGIRRFRPTHGHGPGLGPRGPQEQPC